MMFRMIIMVLLAAPLVMAEGLKTVSTEDKLEIVKLQAQILRVEIAQRDALLEMQKKSKSLNEALTQLKQQQTVQLNEALIKYVGPDADPNAYQFTADFDLKPREEK